MLVCLLRVCFGIIVGLQVVNLGLLIVLLVTLGMRFTFFEVFVHICLNTAV